MKLYIAVRDEVPDHMVPVVVAHAVLGAHLHFQALKNVYYDAWLTQSFKKCVVRVNLKEFQKICSELDCYKGFESTVLDKQFCVAIPVPSTEVPNVLRFAKLWKPKYYESL